MHRPQLLASLLCLALGASACGHSSSSGSPTSPSAPTVPTPAPTAVTVTGLTVTGNGCSGGLCVAPGPIALSAVAQLSNGTTQTVSSQAQWSSSNPGVASVSASGAVTVLTTGDTDVIATYQGRSAGQTIRVPAPWTQSGSGDTVFQMPGYVTKVHIVGSFSGRCQNFVVKIAGRVVVNEILGSCSVGIGATYDGVLVTSGGAVETTISSGVQWRFTQVR